MVTKLRVGTSSLLAMAILSIAVMTAAPPASASGLIYINRCAAGCTVSPGANDAIDGTSNLVASTKNLSAFAHGDAVFSDTVVCLRSLFARYDVDVVTVSPGNLARREMMLAGTAAQLGFIGSLGVAPLTGSPIDNAIAFAFANDIGPDPDKLCWIAATQLGALYGLEVEYYCPDVTSNFSAPNGCGLKTFADFDAPCGTFSAKATCDMTSGLPTQNSAALLATRAGLSDRLFLDEFEQARPAP
jgi:hypothetical protein